MFKKMLPALLVVASPVWAQPVPALNDSPAATQVIISKPALPMTNSLIGGEEKPLSAKESRGLALAQKWMHGTSLPITAGDGAVTYFYGKTQAAVVCAPLKTCDIQLQPGERITKNGVNIGDSTRWIVTPTLSGEGDNQQTHLIVKPTDIGLETSVVVNTNRRTYNIKLVSREKEWMPTVNFDYPEMIKNEWEAYYAAQQQEKEQKTIGNGLNIDNLDFAYRIEGKANFKPVRVYNNGIKTFIELPRSVSSEELPAVLVVNKNSGEKEIVNYGFKDNKFIVDQLAKQIILVQGVGKYQESVLISRER